MSVVVILLMFLAVIAMVKNIDQNRQPQATLALNPSEETDRIRSHSSK